MDFDGTLKEIPATSTKTYAIQMIVPGSSYLVLKIEKDPETFEKKYFPMIDESKMNPLINSEINNQPVKFLIFLNVFNLLFFIF